MGLERRGHELASRYARAFRIRATWFMGNGHSTSIPLIQYYEEAGRAKLVLFGTRGLSKTPAPVATGSFWVGE
jgi:hypothetical protein